MSSVASSEIVGRQAEVDEVRRIATLAGGPRAALIRGEPGIGKTLLWQEGTTAAAHVGVRVLAARCVEAEMPLEFAVLADLVEDITSELGNRLTSPQRAALELALGGDPTKSGDALALPRAVLALLRAAAESGPVLIAVDDEQWIDRASARIVAFSLRRLDNVPLAVLATLRGGPDALDPLRLADAYGAELARLNLGPLSMGALQRLLRVRLGVRLPRPTLSRVQQASGGNPMFALEFARAAEGAGRIDPLRVPASLEELVGGRLERLPPRLRPLLELVAVLERPTVDLIAPAVGGDEEALELVEAATEADALVVGEQDVIRFTHPLFGAAVYGGLTPPARRRLHRRAAELVEEPESRARHVALGCGTAHGTVAALVDEAAAAAARRGAPDIAAELVEHAVRLTRDGDPAARNERRLRLAQYLGESSQTARAAVVLDELLNEEMPESLRAEALVLRATIDDEALRSAFFFKEALRYCSDNRRLRVRVLLSLAEGHAQWLGDLAGAEAFVRAARAEGQALDDVGLQIMILKWRGRIAALRGLPEWELMWSAVELERGTPPPLGQSGARCALAQQLAWAGELAAARELAEEHLSDLERRGNEFDRAWQLPMLAEIELRQGEWEVARRHAAEVEELFDPDDAWGQASARALRAALAVHMGALDEGRQLALEVLAHAEQANLRVNVVHHRWLLGYLELSRGDPTAAWRWLDGLSDDLERMGIREPGFVPLLPDLIEALVGLGEIAQAELFLGRLEAQAAALDHRWATPAAARARALVLLACGETRVAVAEAERAAAEFDARGFPLERARALLVAGQALRRQGDRTRAGAALGTAAEIFERLGAKLWLERAHEERRRANPRPRRDGELTNAERRVADLVAAGRTNAEVAAQLYVTVGTVEAHLTRIYRKLDVRSRVELARRVAAKTSRSEDEN